jgi:purine-nucleoside phosphorylase
MRTLIEDLDDSLAAIADRDDRLASEPFLAMVLGSGLGGVVDELQDTTAIPYSEISGFLSPTVVGHQGRLVIGRLQGTLIAAMQGRVHGYEGHSPDAVVHGVRCMARAGAQAILLTNAAGGIDPSFGVGDLMVIDDHINLTAASPLLGKRSLELGPRFPDMTYAWDVRLADALHRAGHTAGIPIRRGVYVGVQGPQYETPAEVRMMGIMGGSAVGMSTVHEALAIAQMGVRVGGLSTISNAAAGTGEAGAVLDHSHIKDVAVQATARALALLRALLDDRSSWWS